MRSLPPVTLRLRASRRLRGVFAVAHLLAAVAVLLANLPLWLASVLWLALLLSLRRRWAAQLPAALVLRDKGRFEKVGADGTAVEAEVHPDTVVTVPLVVLVHREQGRTRALVLPADSLAEADARTLRLWLRWQGAALQSA